RTAMSSGRRIRACCDRGRWSSSCRRAKSFLSHEGPTRRPRGSTEGKADGPADGDLPELPIPSSGVWRTVVAEDGKPTAEDLKLRLQIETALLGWVRISLALMGFGFVVARFGLFLREIAQVGEMKVKVHPGLAAVNTFAGTTLILLGVAFLLL